MDGNHSLLDAVSHLIHCADVQPPLIINIVLGLPANMCVMWLILTGAGDKAADIFSLNQAMCEVATCMANVVTLIAINTTLSSVGIFTFLFYALRFSWGSLLIGRPLFMKCVSLERYLAVVHPVTFLKYKPLRYRLAGAIITWLTLLVCSTILLWIPNSAISYVIFSIAFTCFLAQLFCCVGTLCALVRPRPGEGNQGSNGMDSAKLKAFRIILIITVTTSLCYLPYMVSVILIGHTSKENSSKLFCFTGYSVLVTGFVPPLLYIHRAGKLPHCIKDTV